MIHRVLQVLLLVTLGAASASAEGPSSGNEGAQLAQLDDGRMWAVYWQAVSNPPQATVDKFGELPPPWEVIKVDDWTGAWAEVCKLTRFGDSLGRMFISPAISNGAIICDGNCFCVPG